MSPVAHVHFQRFARSPKDWPPPRRRRKVALGRRLTGNFGRQHAFGIGALRGGQDVAAPRLAMLDPLQSGRVCWKGHTVRHDAIPAFRAAVIYLHQRAAMLDETVEGSLRRPFTLHVHRHREFDRSRIVDLLGQLGRDESFLTKRAGDLSGGEIQITALLRACQLEPTVLLLDEPTAGARSAHGHGRRGTASPLGRHARQPVEKGDWLRPEMRNRCEK